MKVSVPRRTGGKGVETWFPLDVESWGAVAAASAVDWHPGLLDGWLYCEFFHGESLVAYVETWFPPAPGREPTASRRRPSKWTESLRRLRALGGCFRHSPAARDGGLRPLTRTRSWKPGFHSCATLSGRKLTEDKMSELIRFHRPVEKALEIASLIPWERLQASQTLRRTLITLRPITLPVTTWSTAHV